jgi:hypothetical protein
MPEFLKMGFEAKNRMIGTPAPFLGIVADARPLGFAVDRQDHGIYIEGQGGSRRGDDKQSCSKLIVQSHDLTDGFGRKSLQKTAQCGLVGKLRKPYEREKGPIVLKNLGLVDSSQTYHDRIQKR